MKGLPVRAGGPHGRTADPDFTAGTPRGSLRHAARRAVLRGVGRIYRRRPSAGAPHSLLLIRPDHLGDLLLLTPALRALRQALPGAHLAALVGPWGQAALATNDDLDEIIVCPFPGFERKAKQSYVAPYRLLAATARTLAGRFDTAIVLRFDHWWGAWLAAAAGIPRRIGYNWPETVPFLTESAPYVRGRHEVEQNWRLLAHPFPALPEPAGLRYLVPDDARRWAGEWLGEQGARDATLVGIHAGAGAEVKQWPADAWATVADGLAERHGARILLTGSQGERVLVDCVKAAMRTEPVDATGLTDLPRLAALMERCRLVLGADSGPMHLAVAAGARTLHLHGPVSAEAFGPWGPVPEHVALVSPWTCVPCNRLDWSKERLPLHGCMSGIAPAQVLDIAAALLAGVPDTLLRED